jgi:hypothetical protein
MVFILWSVVHSLLHSQPFGYPRSSLERGIMALLGCGSRGRSGWLGRTLRTAVLAAHHAPLNLGWCLGETSLRQPGAQRPRLDSDGLSSRSDTVKRARRRLVE